MIALSSSQFTAKVYFALSCVQDLTSIRILARIVRGTVDTFSLLVRFLVFAIEIIQRKAEWFAFSPTSTYGLI